MTAHTRRGKILLAASAALVLLIALSAMWWKDEPLSDETRGLLRQSTVGARDNAYFFLLGFNASTDRNPDELGGQAVARYQAQLAAATIPTEAGWPNTLLVEDSGLHFSENVLANCIKESAADIVCVINNRASIDEALKQNSVLLERYTRLLQYQKYANPAPGGIGFLIPPFTEIQRAKLALWAKAILRVHDGRTAEALDLMEKDIRFWRMLSAQADNLLTRMVGVAVLRNQYELLSQMIAHFPALVAPGKDRLLQMAAPFSPQEQSFRNALAGELRVVAGALTQIDKLPTPAQGTRIPGCVAVGDKDCIAGPPPPVWSLDHALWRKTVLFRPNATMNLQARLLDRWATLSEMPPQQFAAKKEVYLQTLQKEFPFERELPGLAPYNLLGRRLVAASLPDLSAYFERMHDLSGLISLVNLQTQIAAFGIPDERVGPFLQTSEAALSNPYTGEAMQWDPKTRSLYFKGRGIEGGGEIAVMLGKPAAAK